MKPKNPGNLPDGRIPDRLPDGSPAVKWRHAGLREHCSLAGCNCGGMAAIFVSASLLRFLHRGRFCIIKFLFSSN